MLLIEPVRFCNPASGGYTLVISVACQWEVYNTGRDL
ncbi:hypothetical protein SLEP1_g28802 [Rubroshorea leprosula]|uniref:Uncharacterized protein n=1 Tax=Rubroshorea leprosula TaxID=152421 RepID=A0AAV5JUT7_9ROSI|nr:hypothetical protein SLEP1_g28802 [Rubroshorea leprosula]